MSDGLPDDEQLGRIRRGVRQRIDRRRAAVRGLATGAVVVVLLAGGVGLVARTAGSSGASSGSGTSGRAAAEVVECHRSSAADSATTAVKLPSGASTAQAAAACGDVAVDFQSSTGRMPTASSRSAAASAAPPSASATPSVSPPRSAVVCRAADGLLHVYPADGDPRTLCRRNGRRDA